LRLLDDKTLEPLAGVQLHVLRPGNNHNTEVTTNREGLAASSEDYKHFAVVSVLAGEATIATFPVALTGDRPVVARLKGLSEAEARAPFEIRKEQWVRRVYDDLRLASDRIIDLNGLLNKSVEGALVAAKVGLGAMNGELKNLAQERDELVRQGAERKIP